MSRKPYFELDGITLYHADCRHVLPELAPGSFEMVLTDPPYLVSYAGRWDGNREVIEGDSDPSWLRPVFSEVWRVLKEDALCLSFYGWPQADVFLGTWKQVGFRPVSLLVLIKDRWGFGQFTRAQHETPYLLAKGHPKPPARAVSDVFDWVSASPLLHPNQKPLGAIATVIATYASRAAALLDPFCGCGTTLVAARMLGIHAVGIEIEERFCEVAALRLSQRIFDFTAPQTAPRQLTLT